MSFQFSLNQRLSSKFNSFRKNDEQLTDARLDSQTNYSPIYCHRIVLARESEWFKEYFAQHPLGKGERQVRVVLPFNSENIFTDIIQFIYENKIQITLKNLPPLYHCAHFYKFRKLMVITKMHLQRALTKQTAIFLSTNLVKYHMDEAAALAAPFFAEDLLRIHDKQTSTWTKKEIFKSISPYVLSVILKDPQLDVMSPSEKVELIDEYVNDTIIESESDKEALASVIDWSAENAHNILVANNCDWLPARLSRSLFSKAITARRETLNSFNKTLETASDFLGRWYPLAWLTSIAKAETCKDTPKIEAIEFMSTFGIYKKKFDPRKFSLVDVSSSKPLSQDFLPSAFLTGDGYFVSRTEAGELPFFEIDFGIHAGIQTYDLGISCEVKNAQGTLKEVPKKLVINGYVQGSDEPIYTRSFSYKKAKVEDNFRLAPLECAVPIRKLKISVKEDSGYGFNIFRLSGLHVNCSFVPV